FSDPGCPSELKRCSPEYSARRPERQPKHQLARALRPPGWPERKCHPRRQILQAFRFPSGPARNTVWLRPRPDGPVRPSLRRVYESRPRRTRARFRETFVRLRKRLLTDARQILQLPFEFDSYLPDRRKG